MKSCPECLGDMPDAAAVCASCGNRVVGKQCPDCAELAKHTAKKCPHCGHSVAREQKIPWEKIAGYHYHAGLFWDSVEIQARGQKANSIGCLPKASGLKVKEILERMKE